MEIGPYHNRWCHHDLVIGWHTISDFSGSTDGANIHGHAYGNFTLNIDLMGEPVPAGVGTGVGPESSS